jgi:hypothetical protein
MPRRSAVSRYPCIAQRARANLSIGIADPIAKAEAVGYGRELEIAVAGLKEMYKRGIKILPGGDYGFAWTPHGTYRDLEVRLF